MGLLDLSTELLLQVLCEVAPASLFTLSLTNRRLHQITIPRLYESVYFWGTDNRDTTERCFEDGETGEELYDRQQAPKSASRVFNLEKLGQALQHSPELALYIKKVELTWGADEDMEDEKIVARFLDVTKFMELENLVLGPPSLYFQVPTYATVTNLRTRHEGHYGGLDDDIYPDIDQLHKQCCIPSLEELSINGWIYWGSPMNDTSVSPPPLGRAKTSSIVILRISTLGAPGHTFEAILSWPKKLRVFHFKCEPYLGCGSQYQMDSRIDSEDFIQPLQNCHDTLEELSIRCYVGENDGVPRTSKPIDLSNFSALKRLCIRPEFLLTKRSRRKTRLPDLKYDGNPPSFHHVLPSSLEILHLEIVYDNFQVSAVSEDMCWMFDMLESLAIHKSEYLPRLRTVIAGASPDFGYDHKFSNVVNTHERGAEVKAAFARGNVQFSCWESDDKGSVFAGWQKR